MLLTALRNPVCYLEKNTHVIYINMSNTWHMILQEPAGRVQNYNFKLESQLTEFNKEEILDSPGALGSGMHPDI